MGGLQGTGRGALRGDARDGHGEVLHPHRDLHAGACLWRQPDIPTKTNRWPRRLNIFEVINQ